VLTTSGALKVVRNPASPEVARYSRPARGRARASSPARDPGGIEPVLEGVTEYTATGMRGLAHVRFGVIHDRGPGAAARARRQNDAMMTLAEDPQ
jgi:hypothetical protein